jgi:transposase
MQDLLGQPLAEGTLQSALEECYQGLEQTEELICEGVRNAEIAHFDETGLRVEGKGQWLHVATTTNLTHYAYHLKRGRAATDEIAILPAFGGRAIHDGLRSYMSYPCDHALCNAHHLRELTFLAEEMKQKWATEMKALLVEIKQRVETAIEEGNRSLSAEEIEKFESRYYRILKRGLRAESLKPALETGKRGPKKQSKAKNLLDRLMRYRAETLAFMYDFRVPFDNNLAERDLRMMKVQQKISGSFRKGEGAKIFCRIRSYISTMRKQGHNVLTALKSVFAGRPIAPALSG